MALVLPSGPVPSMLPCEQLLACRVLFMQESDTLHLKEFN